MSFALNGCIYAVKYENVTKYFQLSTTLGKLLVLHTVQNLNIPLNAFVPEQVLLFGYKTCENLS